jgi:hypothetical protein
MRKRGLSSSLKAEVGGMRLVIAGVGLEFLDALTTYVIITLGLGYEANPRIFFINDLPEWVFLIFMAQAAFIGGVAYLAWLERRLGFMRAYYVTAGPLAGYIIHKAVVVANNVAVGAVGFEGLDFHFSEAVKMFMVMGGLTYGIVKSQFFKPRLLITYA